MKSCVLGKKSRLRAESPGEPWLRSVCHIANRATWRMHPRGTAWKQDTSSEAAGWTEDVT